MLKKKLLTNNGHNYSQLFLIKCRTPIVYRNLTIKSQPTFAIFIILWENLDIKFMTDTTITPITLRNKIMN